MKLMNIVTCIGLCAASLYATDDSSQCDKHEYAQLPSAQVLSGCFYTGLIGSGRQDNTPELRRGIAEVSRALGGHVVSGSCLRSCVSHSVRSPSDADALRVVALKLFNEIQRHQEQGHAKVIVSW